METVIVQPKRILSLRNILVAVLVILALVAGWYFLYWKKTPAYSLNLIREAVAKHDVVAFEKHVNMDSLLNRAFDDFLLATMAADKDIDQGAKVMAMGFAQMFKQPVVTTMKEALKRYVEKGSFEEQNGQNNGNNNKLSPAEVSKKTGITASDFKGIAYTKKDGKTATVGIKLYEKQLNKEMILELKLNELEDGTWRLTEIANLQEYIANFQKYTAEKLDELNKPIKEQISGTVATGPITARVAAGDRWGFSQKLTVNVPFLFPQGILPASLHGVLTVESATGSTLLKSGITAEGFLLANNQTPRVYSFDLNQFMDGHKAIIAAPANSLKINVAIDQLKLTDGTVVKLLDKLPES